MGILDSLKSLGAGSGRSTVAVPPLESEQEILRTVASANPGQIRSTGGELVLTSHRIYFSPWNTSDLSGVLAWVLPKVGATRLSASAVKAIQAQVDATGVEASRQALSQVRRGSGPSLLKPPTVVFDTSDGTTLEFGVLAGFASPNYAKANVVARDAFVQAASNSLLNAP